MSQAIERAVYHHARMRGYYWIVPEISYGNWFADFICCGPQKGVLEVEIKRSWSDYQNDYLKSVTRFPTQKNYFKRDRYYNNINKKPQVMKYKWLLGSYPCPWRPEYFVYAAPTELAERIAADPNLPKPFGVWPVKEVPASGTRLEYANVQYHLKRMRRLITLTSEQRGRFKNDIFKRALTIVDKIYDYPIQPTV